MRKFEFVNAAAKREFLDLPKPIQRQFGADLQAVQAGLAPFSRWKHLTETVGIGAVELIENGSTAYRTVYCAKFGETVFILHSFTKTTNGVDRKAMALARERYRLMQKRLTSG